MNTEQKNSFYRLHRAGKESGKTAEKLKTACKNIGTYIEECAELIPEDSQFWIEMENGYILEKKEGRVIFRLTNKIIEQIDLKESQAMSRDIVNGLLDKAALIIQENMEESLLCLANIKDV